PRSPAPVVRRAAGGDVVTPERPLRVAQAENGTDLGNGGTAARIEEAALELFFVRGYKSTSMRDIAQALGITAAALYNHYPSKDQILYAMVSRLHQELEGALLAALEAAGPDPRDRLGALVRAHALIHTKYRKDAHVANSEIFSLIEPGRDEVIASRRRMRDSFQAEIGAGVERGVFRVEDALVATFAIINMGIRIAEWFVPGGRLTAEQVADMHAELALRMVGARPRRNRNGTR
ncbi:MAG: TetR/AcrR family transcriptional regulator, partial [Actinomycetota bacterium]